MKALEIKDLIFKYDINDNVPTLDRISFNVEQGEYVTIIGHNGSGKSTLAKLIVGLLEANEGEIFVFKHKLDEKNAADIRNRVGIVFQNPDNQFIGATVRDDIAFGLENNCVEQNKMDEIIEHFAQKVNMLDFLDKEPSALSGGQKQRVAIAGILAMNPDILIMDESTAMLDPRGKKEIIEFTNNLKKENPNLTIISITHDIEEAYLSDRCIVLDHGKIIYNDKPYKVFEKIDELEKIDLDVPFSIKLFNKLKKVGVDIGDDMSLEGMKKRLCQ